MTKKRLFALALAPVLAFIACSSSSTAPTGGDAGSERDATVDGAGLEDAGGLDVSFFVDAVRPVDTGVGCELAYYASDYAPACQPVLDKYCCSQEKSCAADGTCRALVNCINDCPPPRDPMCISACGDPSSGTVAAISICRQMPPYAAPQGVDCSWPQ